MATRVLIAESDPSTKGELTAFCQTLQVDEVESVTCGCDAEQSLAKKSFDIYVLSHDLRDMTGLDLLQRIRQKQRTAPVLLVTEQAGKQYYVEAVKSGASDFITKPLDKSAVTAKLRSWFQLVARPVESTETESPPTPSAEAPSEAPALVDCLNPFVRSVRRTFHTMFQVELDRGIPYRVTQCQPPHELTGVIRLSGRASGTAALSVERHVAYEVTSRMIGSRVGTIDANVRDAIGEVANIVTGAAKAELEQLQLHVSLPTVLIGRHQSLEFPGRSVPIAVPFQSYWGDVTILFALTLNSGVPAVNTAH